MGYRWRLPRWWHRTPYFSIVVATYNRGRHIVPTIEAALDQTFKDFELLVVGDGVTDDTLEQVPRHDRRIRVIALSENSGSQARPNNTGIAAARGRHIAYLGHDDIWMPRHLELLANLLDDETECDVAVSGCAYHGPPGTDLVEITGLFEDPAEAPRYFFPPTSLAHRRSLATEIGGWRDPDSTTAPVDWDFLLRASAAGARYRSTGEVTAQKFAAGHRYLSYLDPSSDEQREMLAAIRRGAIDRDTCQRYVDHAKVAGTFMPHRDPDFTIYAPGQLYRVNRSNKGIERPEPVPLTEEISIVPTGEPRALDWYPLTHSPDGSPVRRSGPSIRPKLLIPFTGNLMARITLHLGDEGPANVLGAIRLSLNGVAVEHRTHRPAESRIDLELTGMLRADKPSALQLCLPLATRTADVPGQPPPGVILYGFTIAPVDG